MRTSIKERILRFAAPELFKNEHLYLTLIEEHRKRMEALTVSDLVREKLKGFNPRLLDYAIKGTDGTNIIYEAEKEGLDIEQLLAKMDEYHKSEHLQFLFNFLLRNQIVYSTKEANTFEQANFGRAEISGIEAVRDLIAKLKIEFDETHAPPEDYDEHEVV